MLCTKELYKRKTELDLHSKLYFKYNLCDIKALEFTTLCDVCLAPNGDDILVSIDFKVFVVDNHGNQITEFGSLGSGIGEFNQPTDICVIEDNIYIAEPWNQRIQVFDQYYKPMSIISMGHHLPTYIHKFWENILVVTYGGPILIIDTHGNMVGDTHILQKCGTLRVNSFGQIVILDDSNTISIFDRNGQTLESFALESVGHFTTMSMDTNDNIIASDGTRLVAFTNRGKFIQQIDLTRLINSKKIKRIRILGGRKLVLMSFGLVSIFSN